MPKRHVTELFPIFLKLNGRRALVVGGGKIAALRAGQLIRTGASVTVVAPKVNAEIKDLAKAGSIELNRRGFDRADLSKHYFIVVAATNDPATQKAVFEEAERHGILCNVVDNPPCCNFYTPAVVERGDLKIAIGTSGRSPYLAGKLRQHLEEAVPENAADLTEAVGLLRSRLKVEIPGDLEKQKELVDDFVEKVLKK
ncbi:MAG: bifunctional precorrin-2 dehydrogenase/sirohydrochlorin ferrochelatase [Acidobacteriota bacterium]